MLLARVLRLITSLLQVCLLSTSGEEVITLPSARRHGFM